MLHSSRHCLLGIWEVRRKNIQSSFLREFYPTETIADSGKFHHTGRHRYNGHHHSRRPNTEDTEKAS